MSDSRCSRPIAFVHTCLLVSVAAVAHASLAGAPGPCDVTAVAGGLYHSIALAGDGTVWVWGNNGNGQVGDGTTINRSRPVQLGGLADVTAIAGGWYHSLAVKNDGTAWAWGYNYWGELGDGTTTDRRTPAQVSGLGGITAVAGGHAHSLALRTDGTVWAWGNNDAGVLGDGTTTQRLTPVPVRRLSDVTAIAAGAHHSLALASDGTVWAWGDNFDGQLGDGTTTNRSTPVQVRGLTSVVAIAAGHSHSLAVTSDGFAWAWGGNDDGQLGDGTTVSRSMPINVSGLAGVVAIAGGRYHSLAVESDGTAWAWGGNDAGQLGDGTNAARRRPAQVFGLTSVTAVAGGEEEHSLALASDGVPWAWGRNSEGQLGDGTTVERERPVQCQPIGPPALSMTCPANTMVECPGDTSPGSTGQPTTRDGCGPVTISFDDVVTAGCGGTSTIERTFTATDGRTSASCTQSIVVSDTTPPVLVPGSIASCHSTAALAEAAAIAATVATDACPGPITMAATARGSCTAAITVTATDACGNAASVTYTTRIDGNAPTVVPMEAPVACLWPPDHRMHRVAARDLMPVITDDCAGPLTWLLSGCVSDQSDDALGDGSTGQDCRVAADGSWAEMRAERSGSAQAARHYALLVIATDECGNASASMPAFEVVVPHDASPAERCR